MNKGKILVVAQRPSDYVEMRRSADAMRKAGYDIEFLYHLCAPSTLPSEAAVLEDAKRALKTREIVGFEVIDFASEGEEGRKVNRGQRFRGRISAMLVHFYYTYILRSLAAIQLQEVFSGILCIFCYIRSNKSYRDLLERLAPDIIVLPEDVVGVVTPQIIKAGHRAGIASLVLPYTIANHQEAFGSLRQQPNYFRAHPFNWLVSNLFPRWVMRQDGLALVRLPGPHILAHEITRTTPPDPWMMNSGFANAIAVENKAMWRYYKNAGLPDSKLRVVGAVYDDHLARFVMDKATELPRLRQELGITNDKPVLLIGGCPDQTGNCSPGGFEFADMTEFCEKLADAVRLMQQYYEVIVRPHPNFPEMGDALAKSGFRTTRIDTARLIALSEVYVAFASATIRWAIACGVPVVNYDVFHYDYDDFASVGGVMHVSSLSEFGEALSGLIVGSEAFVQLKQSQREASCDWGILDGRATERICALIEELRAIRPAPRSAV